MLLVLPESVLEGDQYVLQSELESIVSEAILNNIPGEALGREFEVLKRIRGPSRFISRGKYLALSRPLIRTVTPGQINNIRIRSPLSLKHFLRKYYKWDGRSTISLEIMAFRILPGRGRLSDVVRDYFRRRTGTGRLRPDHFRHFHLMSHRTSRILRAPILFSPSIPTYFIIRRAVLRRGTPFVVPSNTPLGKSALRPNEIKIGIDTLGRLRASFYLNPETVSRLSSLGSLRIRALRSELNRLIAQDGLQWLKRLFTRLKIPNNFSALASRLLLRHATAIINKSALGLIQKIQSFAHNPRGVTAVLQIQLPTNITQVVRKLSPLLLPSLNARLLKSAFSIATSAGYNI